jgi:acetyl esterase
MDIKGLHPEARFFVEAIHSQNKTQAPCIDQTRKNLLLLCKATSSKRVEVRETREFILRQNTHEYKIRAYYPFLDTPLPLMLFFHGGAFLCGNLDTHDHLCRRICTSAHVIVLSVDYRLAPENKFPAALEDAYQALLWVFDNASKIEGNNKRIIACGDSAGGNISAVLCQMTRDRKGPELFFQILINPACDFYQRDKESYHKYGKGYPLSKEDIEWGIHQYLDDVELLKNPYVSPLMAKDFTGLPDALVISSEFDILRDEAEAYAEKLRAGGAQVILKRFDGMIHDFILYERILSTAGEAIDLIAHTLHKTCKHI